MPDRLIAPDPGLDAQEKRVIILRQVFLALLIIWLMASTSILLYNAYVGAQTRTTLIDCVEPKGECAKRGAKQTGKVVEGIIKQYRLGEVATRRVVVLAAVCSEEVNIRTEPDYSTRIRLMEECVNAQLDKEAK